MNDELGCGGDVDCQKALDDLYAYVDGWSEGTERTSIEDHLAACAPCVDAYDFQASLKKLISSTCRSVLPDDVRSRILEAIANCDGEPSTDTPVDA
ncbi:MAG: zf-HC2 domain-containing protein [Acidimicrobiales bacterium]